MASTTATNVRGNLRGTSSSSSSSAAASAAAIQDKCEYEDEDES